MNTTWQQQFHFSVYHHTAAVSSVLLTLLLLMLTCTHPEEIAKRPSKVKGVVRPRMLAHHTMNIFTNSIVQHNLIITQKKVQDSTVIIALPTHVQLSITRIGF